MAQLPKVPTPEWFDRKNEPAIQADINKLNADVRKWSFETKNMLAQEVRMLTNRGKVEYIRQISWQRLAPNIRPRTIIRDGMAERVTMSYPAHGYYISVGSGRGHHKNKNPRRIVDWYNQILDRQTETLADRVASHIDTLTVRISTLS